MQGGVGGDLFKEDSSKSEMQGLQDGKQEADKCSNQRVLETIIFFKDTIELELPVYFGFCKTAKNFRGQHRESFPVIG